VETKLATIERLVGSDAPVLDLPAVGAARGSLERSLHFAHDAEPAPLEALGAVESLRAEIAGDEARIPCDTPAASAFHGDRSISLFAIHWRGTLRLLLCDANGVHESMADATALLRCALRHNTTPEPRTSDVAAAIRWLRAEQSAAVLRSPRTTAAQRAAAAKVLALTRNLPAQSPLALRADQLLRVLAKPLPLELLPGLALWAETRSDGVNAYAALEEILSKVARSSRERANSPRVLAVLHVSSGE
jgi:hypothetical protein